MSKLTLILETVGEVAHAVSRVVDHIEGAQGQPAAERSVLRLAQVASELTDLGVEIRNGTPIASVEALERLVGKIFSIRDLASGVRDVDDDEPKDDAAAG